VTKKGDHALRGQEIIIVMKILEWIAEVDFNKKHGYVLKIEDVLDDVDATLREWKWRDIIYFFLTGPTHSMDKP